MGTARLNRRRRVGWNCDALRRAHRRAAAPGVVRGGAKHCGREEGRRPSGLGLPGRAADGHRAGSALTPADLSRATSPEETMSIPCKFERSILNHDEHELILRSHHTEIYEAGLDDLKALRQRLRDMRDKESTLAHAKRHEARGKGPARG